MADDYGLDQLAWDSVLYGDAEVINVPDDRRGVYAFAICHDNNVLPPNCCTLYVGIAGRKSHRPLRDRYLNAKKSAKAGAHRPHDRNLA